MKPISISNQIYDYTYHLLENIGVNHRIARPLNSLILLILVLILVIIVHLIVRAIIRRILKKVAARSRYSFFTYLLRSRLPHYLALIVPVSIVKNTTGVIFYGYPKWIHFFNELIDVYIILMIVWMAMSILTASVSVLKEHPTYRGKPWDSYLQVVKMFLYLYAIIIIFSILTDKSPLAFFTAMGAMSAVLLLMFKDSIMGFVASIQVTTNDMVRIGDWITMSKYGADGDVTEINLTTVKVQNSDKTVTTIPTYALISESFQNWRAMQLSGGRRIKRSIFIKQQSVKFLEDSELDKYSQIQGLSEYISDKNQEIKKYNTEKSIDKSLLINGRNLTNLGLFRKYAEYRIRTHPFIHQDMTLLVRQLAPTDKGLPIEIYCFTKTTNWSEYETIMADVFDHLIASVKYFDLEIYESMSN